MSARSGAPARVTAVGIRREGERALGVDWADGSTSVIPLREIRLACGCAVCRDELTGDPLLNPAAIPADIRAHRIAPVGHYALTFDWSDSHSTGIYPWEMLRALADRLPPTPS
jgi:ATP-binding protein involved in chromosome partitioning